MSCLEAKQGWAWQALGWEAERGSQSRWRVGLGAVPHGRSLPRGGGSELSSGLCALHCAAETPARLRRPCRSGLDGPGVVPLPRLSWSVGAAQLSPGGEWSLFRGFGLWMDEDTVHTGASSAGPVLPGQVLACLFSGLTAPHHVRAPEGRWQTSLGNEIS